MKQLIIKCESDRVLEAIRDMLWQLNAYKRIDVAALELSGIEEIIVKTHEKI